MFLGEGEVKMLYEIGRICVKLAGRDAGKKCVIVDVLDDVYVLIDGETRRRKCNVAHLEPLTTSLPLKKNASHDAVVKEFDAINIKILSSTPKKATAKPVAKRTMSKQKKSKSKSVSLKKKSTEKAVKTVQA